MPEVTPDSSPIAPPRCRRWWPVAPVLLVVAGLFGLFLDSWTASTPTLLVAVAAPLVAAVVLTSLAVGGRRGAAVGVLLAGLLAYWAWWFGWGLDWNISPFSADMAAAGLADAAGYEVALLLMLWPIVVFVAAIVVVCARRRRRPIGRALGLLVLALVLLSFPSRASWDDTCNTTTGSAPLLTRPITQQLMDNGIGVLPGGCRPSSAARLLAIVSSSRSG